MPPTRMQLGASVNLDTAQYLEKLWNKERQRLISEGKRTPTLARFIGEILEEWVRQHKIRHGDL